ncbi:hypothetical protein [Algoriphagus mannitolivorans]|uniref:hypothetical protein n=1 Tax=Algoriphagus mannitolivorans TaxID=226504 RepID=UPI00047A0114|nr:hypothetical protein [Algoriphagus mannitolivorans]
MKHPTENRFDPLIVRYFPTDESSKRDFKDFNYQQIDEKWSGSVDIFTYDEHYFIGFEIDAGQVLGTRKMEVIPNGQRKSFSKENLDYKCTIVEIETTWVQFTYIKETNTWYVQTLSPTSSTSYYCPMESGIDSSNSPGTTYTYPDYTTSLGGGAGGYNPPDVPMPRLTIYIDPSFSSNSKLKCVQEILSLSKFVSSLAEFQNKTSPKNVTLKVGNTINPNANAETDGRTYGHNNIVITFNIDKVNNMKSLEVARVLLHEIIHAEIFNAVGEKRGSILIGNFNTISKNIKGYIIMIQTNNTILWPNT